jgi:hypothetical protein
LGHFAEVGATTALSSISIHCPGKSGGDIHEARLVRHLKPKAQ